MLSRITAVGSSRVSAAARRSIQRGLSKIRPANIYIFYCPQEDRYRIARTNDDNRTYLITQTLRVPTMIDAAGPTYAIEHSYHCLFLARLETWQTIQVALSLYWLRDLDPRDNSFSADFIKNASDVLEVNGVVNARAILEKWMENGHGLTRKRSRRHSRKSDL